MSNDIIKKIAKVDHNTWTPQKRGNYCSYQTHEDNSLWAALTKMYEILSKVEIEENEEDI